MARSVYRPDVLNKITGCESRTVPPLYVLIPHSFGESQSLRDSLGRQKRSAEVVHPQGMSQKTYEVSSPTVCAFMDGVLVAEKRLRRLSSGRRSLFVFRRKKV